MTHEDNYNITNCTFKNNSCTNFGGAIAYYQTNPQNPPVIFSTSNPIQGHTIITSSVFQNNTAFSGSAIYAVGHSITFVNTVVTGHTQINLNVITLQDAQYQFKSSIVANNTGTGIFCQNSSVSFIEPSVFGNTKDIVDANCPNLVLSCLWTGILLPICDHATCTHDPCTVFILFPDSKFS
jgi:predicted outer membrane repeat protein